MVATVRISRPIIGDATHHFPNTFTNQTLRPTGATDGIGYEYACFFARKGYNLLLISRNQEKLEDTKQKIADKYPKCKEIRIHQADFTSTAIYTDIKRVVEELPRVDVLVNNVGISYKYPEYLTKIVSMLKDL